MREGTLNFYLNLEQNEAQSACAESTHKGVNPLGPRPAAALSLRNPLQREVTGSNDPGIQL